MHVVALKFEVLTKTKGKRRNAIVQLSPASRNIVRTLKNTSRFSHHSDRQSKTVKKSYVCGKKKQYGHSISSKKALYVSHHIG